MKYIYIILFLALVTGNSPVQAASGSKSSSSGQGSAEALSAPTGDSERKANKKGKRASTPVAPGSMVVMLKGRKKAEIRPDRSVWWYGANYRKAIMADGVHELRDGQKITTKGGKLVGKPPKILRDYHEE